MNNQSKANLIIEYLLQINAIKINLQNPFTWASGVKSPIYTDNRILLSYPEVRSLVKNAFAEKINQVQLPDVIAGVATAGIPHGVLVADVLGLPFIYVRDKAKEHGKQNIIEGAYKENQKVVVIEDLISTGKSSIKTVETLRQVGLNVLEVMSIFSYELAVASRNFEAINCPYSSLSRFSILSEVALENKYISEKEYSELIYWHKNL
ncbi:MAG: orotate phosphoribosyltransferase [Saprospiraceae bacterium]|nr:orotate phosphoribosyltransferase [Saprospiraceae bacterium]